MQKRMQQKLKLEFKLKKSNVGVHRQLYLTPPPLPTLNTYLYE